jgi:DNA segregation ATPase FtsK/SpoIIIE, S-DNA-T family
LKQRDLVLNILILFLLLFVSLILQALIIENPYERGEIGNILVDSLSPIIGRAGLYFFVLVGFIISIIVLFEDSEFNLSDLKRFKNKIKLRNTIDIKKIENKKREKRAEDVNQTIYNNIEKKIR